MADFDWKSALGHIAPVLAGMVSGPFAPLAIGATAALSNLFLGHANGTEDQVAAALQAITPEQAIQLKQLDLQMAKQQADFALGVKQANTADAVVDVDNTKDARARDIAVRAGNNGYNLRSDLAVLAVILGLFGCLWILTFYKDKIPGEVVGIISVIAGIFGGCLKDYFNFEFGSSRGSQNKDATIKNLSEK
jgi:hypothetical protein